MEFGNVAFVQPLAMPSRSSSSQRYLGFLQNSSVKQSLNIITRKRKPSKIVSMQNGAEISAEDAFREVESDVREYLNSCADDEKSPLAYVTLRKNGRVDLVSRIMDAGGYIQVSQRLGIPLEERFTKTLPATSAFDSQPSLSNNFDYDASIAIGKALEERLDTIEDVVKDTKPGEKGTAMRYVNAVNTDRVPSAEQIIRQNESYAPPIVDEYVPEGERMNLSFPMRIGMLSLVVSIALGFGRASQGIISEDIIQLCQRITGGLAVAHVMVGLYGGFVVAPSLRRNSLLWAAKVVLSGPLGLRELRKLGTIEE